MKKFNSKDYQLPEQDRQTLLKVYQSMLCDNVIPWWEKHSLDFDAGGYFTRLNRQGAPYSYDKDMWMTGRAIWMFSHLFNNFKQETRWKDFARHGLDFMLRHAFRDDGKMHFRLDRNGKPLASCLSLYTEVFAAIAIAEYWKCDPSDDLKDRAIRMFDFMKQRLGQPTDTPLLGYPLNVEFHLHAHDMVRLTVAWVYHDVWPDEGFEKDIIHSCKSILDLHWKPELNALLENVAMNGAPMLDLPEGRLFHPGHAIESAWMIMEAAEMAGDEEMFNTAIDIAIASMEQGWDEEFGGIRYLTNIDWTPTHNLEADLKLWWPHSEALYALLLAWAKTGRDDLRDWYQKVHDYTFAHFPDEKFGEWYGYLNRDGSPVWTAKANGWKGFFHLPRALFRCYQLLAG